MDHAGGSAIGRVHFCSWLIKSHFFFFDSIRAGKFTFFSGKG